jgi:hypothetical protein
MRELFAERYKKWGKPMIELLGVFIPPRQRFPPTSAAIQMLLRFITPFFAPTANFSFSVKARNSGFDSW